ncbi:hypothetical protein T11_4098 [Trichinella zimbabwensis]|uniref:Uncharacterized protein n=1 Tax=Trichinella zimbabwensis TaxID=268475 RepID=A0A0V1GZK5_9BILA|nr:hypothetical protein T11_4098 [Trichinella zimbabwensis]
MHLVVITTFLHSNTKAIKLYIHFFVYFVIHFFMNGKNDCIERIYSDLLLKFLNGNGEMYCSVILKMQDVIRRNKKIFFIQLIKALFLTHIMHIYFAQFVLCSLVKLYRCSPASFRIISVLFLNDFRIEFGTFNWRSSFVQDNLYLTIFIFYACKVRELLAGGHSVVKRFLFIVVRVLSALNDGPPSVRPSVCPSAGQQQQHISCSIFTQSIHSWQTAAQMVGIQLELKGDDDGTRAAGKINFTLVSLASSVLYLNV